jgi:rhodanese-related sulfurtransferase
MTIMISSAIGKQSNFKRTARAKDQYMFVDVREAGELEKGKIDGAVHMPLGQLLRKARHDDLKDLKSKKICTYCSGGYRGNMAADELNNQGFDVITIEGGFTQS